LPRLTSVTDKARSHSRNERALSGSRLSLRGHGLAGVRPFSISSRSRRIGEALAQLLQSKTLTIMTIYQIPRNASKSESCRSENQQIPAAKIIDFFAAREVLRSEARSAAQRKVSQATFRAAARREKVVFDAFENAMFLLLLTAAAVLGLLAISGFG
jgi:hypothetical protein